MNLERRELTLEVLLMLSGTDIANLFR